MRHRRQKSAPRGFQIKPLADLECEQQSNEREQDVSDVLPPSFILELEIAYWEQRS